MHGTYEANLAMHGCDVMLNIGARFDDRVTGRLNAFSPGLEENPCRYRPVQHQQERAGGCRRSIGDAAGDSARADRGVEGRHDASRTARRWPMVAADRRVARARTACASRRTATPGAHHQAAIRHRAAVRIARARARDLHHHRGRPAPDVGGAALQVRQAEPLDDLAAGWAPWATACRPPWACRSRIRMRW